MGRTLPSANRLRVQGELVRLRPYANPADIVVLARMADDPRIARWMSSRFPSPYKLADATRWVVMAADQDPTNHFVIEVDGAFAGAVGFEPQDGEYRGVAEFGYWLAPAFWGRGIASEAARLAAHHALTERGLRRLESRVWAPNLASIRVLEKAGFVREGILREGITDRDGVVSDVYIYARLADGGTAA